MAAGITTAAETHPRRHRRHHRRLDTMAHHPTTRRPLCHRRPHRQPQHRRRPRLDPNHRHHPTTPSLNHGPPPPARRPLAVSPTTPAPPPHPPRRRAYAPRRRASTACTHNTSAGIRNVYSQHVGWYTQRVHTTRGLVYATCTHNAWAGIRNVYTQRVGWYTQRLVYATLGRVSATCTHNAWAGIRDVYMQRVGWYTQHRGGYPQHVHTTAGACTLGLCAVAVIRACRPGRAGGPRACKDALRLGVADVTAHRPLAALPPAPNRRHCGARGPPPATSRDAPLAQHPGECGHARPAGGFENLTDRRSARAAVTRLVGCLVAVCVVAAACGSKRGTDTTAGEPPTEPRADESSRSDTAPRPAQRRNRPPTRAGSGRRDADRRPAANDPAHGSHRHHDDPRAVA